MGYNIDYKELEKALTAMKPRQRLYELVKIEMQKRGRWKNIERGWHAKGYTFCLIYCCNRKSINGFYCALHNIQPQTYGATQRRKIPNYGRWLNMLYRCYKLEAEVYKYYGGRGITVCQEWQDSFDKFHIYVSALPREGNKRLSLDRIDDDGNYEPGNLRWTDAHTQINNRGI